MTRSNDTILDILFSITKNFTTYYSKSTPFGFLFQFLLFLTTIFSPIYLNIIFIFCVLIADVVLGVAVSIKKGVKFESRKLKKGLVHKLAFYGIIIVSFLGLELVLMKMLQYKTYYIIGVITTMIGFYELTSIVEKMMIIEPNIKVFGRLLKWIKKTDEKIETNIDNKIDKLFDNEDGGNSNKIEE